MLTPERFSRASRLSTRSCARPPPPDNQEISKAGRRRFVPDFLFSHLRFLAKFFVAGKYPTLQREACPACFLSHLPIASVSLGRWSSQPSSQFPFPPLVPRNRPPPFGRLAW